MRCCCHARRRWKSQCSRHPSQKSFIVKCGRSTRLPMNCEKESLTFGNPKSICSLHYLFPQPTTPILVLLPWRLIVNENGAGKLNHHGKHSLIMISWYSSKKLDPAGLDLPSQISLNCIELNRGNTGMYSIA